MFDKIIEPASHTESAYQSQRGVADRVGNFAPRVAKIDVNTGTAVKQATGVFLPPHATIIEIVVITATATTVASDVQLGHETVTDAFMDDVDTSPAGVREMTAAERTSKASSWADIGAVGDDGPVELYTKMRVAGGAAGDVTILVTYI